MWQVICSKLQSQWACKDKPYSCKECGYSFIQNGDLKKHEMIHTGENTYLCKECGQLFENSNEKDMYWLKQPMIQIQISFHDIQCIVICKHIGSEKNYNVDYFINCVTFGYVSSEASYIWMIFHRYCTSICKSWELEQTALHWLLSYSFQEHLQFVF